MTDPLIISEENTLSGRLKAVREHFDLIPVEAYAAAIDASPEMILPWESGEIKPPYLRLVSICLTFRVSEKWLLTGNGDQWLSEKDADYYMQKLLNEKTDSDLARNGMKELFERCRKRRLMIRNFSNCNRGEEY